MKEVRLDEELTKRSSFTGDDEVISSSMIAFAPCCLFRIICNRLRFAFREFVPVSRLVKLTLGI